MVLKNFKVPVRHFINIYRIKKISLIFKVFFVLKIILIILRFAESLKNSNTFNKDIDEYNLQNELCPFLNKCL